MPYPSSHRTTEPCRKVNFQFTKRELRIVESFSGYSADSLTIKTVPLKVQTPIKFVWPHDADVHVTELAKRGCSGHKLVDIVINGKVFAQIRWGSPSYCEEDGYDIAKTIQKCRDAGLAVTVEAMPTAYAEPRALSQKKRKWDEASETVAKSAKLTESVWAVELCPYCKYESNASKTRIESTHLSEAAAEQHAKGWWSRETYGVDNLTQLNRPGSPFSANACVEYGAGIMTVSVVKAPIAELGPALVKRALMLRGASTDDGGPHMLRRRLLQLVSDTNATGMEHSAPGGSSTKCESGCGASGSGSGEVSFSAKDNLQMQMFEGEEKDLILEGGNGLGGGHYVREGVAFLNAYAKALGMSRRAFVHLLRNAPGTLMTCWRESMQLSELREIGEA